MADIGNRVLPPAQLFDSNGNLYTPTNGLPIAEQVYPSAAGPASPVNGAAAAANASNVATLAGVAAKTTYISGVQVTGAGATAASVQTLTLAGLAGGTLTYQVPVPAGAAVGIQPLVIQFCPPLPASAQATAITATLSAFGAGNTNAAVCAQGFQV